MVEFNLSDKESDKYETPNWIMNLFRNYYDPCPINPAIDGLKSEWGNKTYVNPPYSKPLPWILKAIEENKKDKIIVMLLKLDCSTKWYKELVNANAHFMFINERVKFNGKPPIFPNVLVILDKLINKEFNLSKEIFGWKDKEGEFIDVDKVKEFIKINLKDLKNVRNDSDLDDFIERYKQRAGDKLNG